MRPWALICGTLLLCCSCVIAVTKTDSESRVGRADNSHNDSTDSSHTDSTDISHTDSTDSSHTDSTDSSHTDSTDISHTDSTDSSHTDSTDSSHTDSTDNSHTDKSHSDGTDKSMFTEELLVRPLPSGHVYSHFEFTTTWTNPSIKRSIQEYQDFDLPYYDLFPRALGEVIEKYHVRELHLTLTQGLWRHHKWGYPVADAPPGATLWAWFTPRPHEELDQTWRDLVNALSGLFCASLNFIDSTNTASPNLSYRPAGLADSWYSGNSSYLRYAALARENVCTENLTPWKKLLPCDTKAGLASMLYPGPLYSAHYHSLGVHLRPACQTVECTSPHLELVSSVSLVQHRLQDQRQDFTLRHLFSAPLFSTCPLADQSKLYVDVSSNEDLSRFTLQPAPSNIIRSGVGVSARSYAEYDLQALIFETRDAVNVAVRYVKQHRYSRVPSPPLLATRYIAGYGQEGGSIRVVLTSTASHNISVVYLELLPWYLRLYLHPTHQRNTGYLSQLVTGRDRERGWVYESVVQVAPGETVHLSLPFTRALLKWLEYPPDANHGFYLPAATLSAILPTAANVSTNSANTRTLRDKLQVQDGPSFVRVYTETLLVSLPTPDFSMPYNVICLACTVVALAFGPIHNITTKRLTLKKIEAKKSFVHKIIGKVKTVLRLAPKDDTPAAPSDVPAPTDTESESGALRSDDCADVAASPPINMADAGSTNDSRPMSASDEGSALRSQPTSASDEGSALRSQPINASDDNNSEHINTTDESSSSDCEQPKAASVGVTLRKRSTLRKYR